MTTYSITMNTEVSIDDHDAQGLAHAVEEARMAMIQQLIEEDIEFHVDEY
jgi:hypothetical protein